MPEPCCWVQHGVYDLESPQRFHPRLHLVTAARLQPPYSCAWRSGHSQHPEPAPRSGKGMASPLTHLCLPKQSWGNHPSKSPLIAWQWSRFQSCSNIWPAIRPCLTLHSPGLSGQLSVPASPVISTNTYVIPLRHHYPAEVENRICMHRKNNTAAAKMRTPAW